MEGYERAWRASHGAFTCERFVRRVVVVLVGVPGDDGRPDVDERLGVFCGGLDQDFGDCGGESR